MDKKINCIMFIDDDHNDNFIHERIIKKGHYADRTISKNYAEEALLYIKTIIDQKESCPNLIFIDINMPRMNGWEFLDNFEQLPEEIKNKIVITMLSDSHNPEDAAKTKDYSRISEYKTKPLTKEVIEEIIVKHFQKVS